MNITFEEYKKTWLEKEEITTCLTSIEKGRLFALKLLTEYYEIPSDYEHIYQLDGSYDGGIDIAYLAKAEDFSEMTDEDNEIGDVWYIVQSKYGTSYQGVDTLHSESEKILNTITGLRKNLSHETQNVVEKLRNFFSNSSSKDKLVLVFATEDKLHERDINYLKNIQVLGREKLGNLFEVTSISIRSIYEKITSIKDNGLKINIKAKLTNPVPNDDNNRILMGAIKLIDLYDFLKNYRHKTGGDLDKIYDKNIRKFLGEKGKINKKIMETLKKEPDNFGFYNNGITFIVDEWQRCKNQDGVFTLTEPFIVNGCQTVSTVWNVLERLDNKNTGGTGQNNNQWKQNYANAVVMLKIAKVADDDELLKNITRYTNSQNAIKDKDFIALDGNFVKLKKELADKYAVFLEIHRGAWAAQLTLQKKPGYKAIVFDKYRWANVFDLIKVYGSGWLSKAGEALNDNAAFSPNGSVFKEIMDKEDFGVDDLFVAFHLLKVVENKETKKKLGSMKFVFYRVVILLLKPIINKINMDHKNNYVITQCLVSLIKDGEAFKLLIQESIKVIENYLNSADRNTYTKEPSMQKTANLNSFLKNPKILNKEEYSPNLFFLIDRISDIMSDPDTGKGEKIKAALLHDDISDISVNQALLYIQGIEELKELRTQKNLKWKEICEYLEIPVGRASAKEVLKRWVKKNKPYWNPVL